METNGLTLNFYGSIISSSLCCFLLVSFFNYANLSILTLRTIGTIIAPPTDKITISKDTDGGDDLTSGPFLSTETTQTPKTFASIIDLMEKNVSMGTEKLPPFHGTKKELQRNQIMKKCDIYDGRWVYNEKARPMYEPSQCPYLSPQVSCRKNGRTDLDYEKWNWEARDCKIPRFNGTDMLERMRGKRLIIVGDSLNRNQWESLSCLLYSVVPSKSSYVNVKKADYKIFRAKDYQFTLEFYWSPFLIQLDESKPKPRRLLKLDTLPPSAKKWRGADVMVFDTGHWWTHRGKVQTWDIMQYKRKLINNLTTEIALEMAMRTWGHWLDHIVDPSKTTVVFRSISPEHKREHWCYNKTQPIQDESFVNSFPKPIIEVIEKSIREFKTPVRYLNITKLSQYRKDAHPTVYTTKQGKLLTKEQQKQPELFADCSHWCLPGLPDTWNQLLYTSIVLGYSSEAV